MIIDHNMLSLLVGDLNKELHYKLTEHRPMAGEASDYDYLIFVSNGEHITIKFMGIEIWNSQTMERFDSLTVEQKIELTEREHLEGQLRALMMDELNVLSKISML